MWVVWNYDTGYSDESMRFATQDEAQEWMAERYDADFGQPYRVRYEP